MLRSFILDDELHAVELLADYIDRTPGLILVGSDTSPIFAMEKVRQLQPDLLFIDVQMPGLSGMDFLRMLDKDCLIVFTTGHAEYAVEAFALQADDYLLKPISYARFQTCCERLYRRFEERQNSPLCSGQDFFYIQAESKAKIIKILTSELYYVQALNNYVILYHQADKIITYLALKEVEQFLPSAQFSRIHKSYVVNDSKIKTIEMGHVILQSKPAVALPIGLKYRDGFFKKIQKSMLRKKDPE